MSQESQNQVNNSTVKNYENYGVFLEEFRTALRTCKRNRGIKLKELATEIGGNADTMKDHFDQTKGASISAEYQYKYLLFFGFPLFATVYEHLGHFKNINKEMANALRELADQVEEGEA